MKAGKITTHDGKKTLFSLDLADPERYSIMGVNKEDFFLTWDEMGEGPEDEKSYIGCLKLFDMNLTEETTVSGWDGNAQSKRWATHFYNVEYKDKILKDVVFQNQRLVCKSNNINLILEWIQFSSWDENDDSAGYIGTITIEHELPGIYDTR